MTADPILISSHVTPLRVNEQFGLFIFSNYVNGNQNMGSFLKTEIHNCSRVETVATVLNV